ncbi:putative CyP450 monooxygenase [Auricularia subglabra TFB-10046 SS5]|nr:putative CyP450 monooxygenase [Auricularia subglabra TFB-10046 SS5]
MSLDTPLPYFLLLGAAVVLAFRRYRKPRSLPLPPGPPAHPIWGNARDVPATYQWVEFTRFGKLYGPVVHLRVLTKHVILLNSLDAVLDLLNKRGGIYSDRPALTMLTELMGWGWLGSLGPYDTTWQSHRRIYQHYFNEGASKQYHELQTKANLVFLSALLQSPADFMDHIHHLTTSSTLDMSYGIVVTGKDDPWIKLVGDAMNQMTSAGLPGSYAVDWIPALKHIPAWFPGASFKRFARVSKKLSDQFRFSPLAFTKEQMRAGKSGASVAASLLQNGHEGRQLSEEFIANAVGTIYVGGSDTTVSVISAFFLCMVLYPAKQRIAQEELERALGRGHLPGIADSQSVPYVTALMLEVIRLYPVLPMGLPHRVMEDDVYQGMRIPKGSTVLANVWSILRDRAYYSDPEEFRPERFLTNGEVDLKTNVDPRILLFGFGRRLCPGRHFADTTAWLAIATTLSCFDILPAKDEQGNSILPTGELRNGAITCPLPFACAITPRSADTERLLNTVTDGV